MKTTFRKTLCLLVALLLAALAASCSFTTAKVTEAILTDTIDADGMPGDPVDAFPCDATAVYASAKLLNAPDNTQVRVLWTYLTDGSIVDEVTIDSGEIENRYIYSYLEPQAIMPQGDYQVEFFVDDRSEPDASAAFHVTSSSASVKEAFVTRSVSEDGDPGDPVESFAVDAKTLYASAVLEGATQNTQVRILWTYITGGQQIDEVTIAGVDPENPNFYSTLSPTATLPEGDYQVEFFINGAETAAYAVPFTVAVAAAIEPAAITDAHMTSYMEAGGVPVDTITVVEPTGIWYVSAILDNTHPDTMVHFAWYDTNGDLIDTYTFDPEGQSGIYIGGTLEINTYAPAGIYQVALFLDDETMPAALVEFEVKEILQDDQDAGEYLSYTQQEGGFSIDYPSDWTLIEQIDSLAAGFYPPGYDVNGASDDNALMVVALKGGAVGYTLESVLQEWISDTENEGLDDYEHIDSTIEEVSGRNMAMYAYSWSYNGRALYSFDFLVIEGSDLFVITVTFRERDVNDLYPQMEQMVLSFDVM